jgi:GNAT superfamily N-acetyltransferase
MERYGERRGARTPAVDGEHPGPHVGAAANVETLALARKIEAGQVSGLRSCVAAALELFPDCGAVLLEVAGGVAPYCGQGSALNDAVGLGMNGPVTRVQVESITEFYRSRDVPPRAMCASYADASLAQELESAGYLPIEKQSVLVAELDRVQARRDPRIVESTDALDWAMHSARGFKNGDVPTEEELRTPRIIAATRATVLEGREHGEIAITGAMDVLEDFAALFAASTMPAHRGRGWQTALILDRFARAREAGARFAWAGAEPASASERNFLRCGFQLLGTRVLWEKPGSPEKETDHG